MSGRLRGRLLVLAGVVLLALNLRSGLIVVSPLLQQIRTDLGMSPAMAGVLGAVPPTAFAVLGWMTPSVVRWVGLERVAWVAVLVTGGCQLLRPLADGAWEFLGLSALAYAGMGAGNVLLPPLVKRHFPDRMGPVSGMYILLISVGTVAPALVAVPTAELTGWRIAAGAWGVVALSAAVPWLAVDRRVDRRAVLESGATARRYIPVTALLRSQLALGLVGVFGLNSLNAYAMFAWLPSILVESGIDALSAGRYLSLFATMALPLSFAVPWLTVRMRSPLPLVVGFAACYAAGYAGLLMTPTTATAVWVCLAGLGPGTFPLVLTLVNLRADTVAGASALSGFTQGLGYAIAGAGPFVVGLLRDLHGGWTTAFAFLLAGLALQVLAGVAVTRPGNLESQLRRHGGR